MPHTHSASNWSFTNKTMPQRPLPSVPEIGALSAGNKEIVNNSRRSYTNINNNNNNGNSYGNFYYYNNNIVSPRSSSIRRRIRQKNFCGWNLMVDAEKEEASNLVEFEWVLRGEVHSILKQLRAILVECAQRFPVPLYENEGKKTEKLIFSVAPDQLKAIVTLTGDSITHADISFKLAKPPHQVLRTSISQDSPWKLQQVQDAANHLQQAINHIDDVADSYHFKSSDEVMSVVGNILEALQRARASLVIPKKKPIDELIKGRNMKSLSPNLSEDLAVSFYLQSQKLIIAVYQLTTIQGTMRFDSRQAETAVQWLNEVLLLLTTGLRLCQQLKDKISVFSLYKDFTVSSRSPSALSY